MDRLRAVVAALTLGTPFVAAAADITRIASSFEDEDPFGMNIDASFEFTRQRTKILREQLLQQNPAPNPAIPRQYSAELWYTGSDARLNLDVAIGIYRDLQISYRLPIVLARAESWNFVSGTNESNSTIINNCLNPQGGLLDPACPTNGMGSAPLFGVPAETLRGGLDNMHFGMAWAFFNQRHDETKPTWVMGIDYEAPTAPLLDPSVVTGAENRGAVGDRVHKFTLSTALSRRIGLADPYFRVQYTIPRTGPGFYSNCDARNGTEAPGTGFGLGFPANCGTAGWDRKTTGIQSPHTASVVFGSEFMAYEPTGKNQNLAIDLRAMANYIGPGRYYNELSGPMRKLLATSDYVQLGGQFSVTAQAAESFFLRASGMFLYNTDHALTDEKIGVDRNEDGNINLQEGSNELNPNFDFRTDFVSRRFYATESKTFRLDLSATFSF
jgi:hypothetical protein